MCDVCRVTGVGRYVECVMGGTPVAQHIQCCG